MNSVEYTKVRFLEREMRSKNIVKYVHVILFENLFHYVFALVCFIFPYSVTINADACGLSSCKDGGVA